MSLADVLPPSPPTTASRKQRLPTFPIPPTSTPDDSPASGPPSSFGSRKKVNFSSWTNVHHSSEVTNIAKDAEVRPLPPSRDCLASGRSILKANVQASRISAGHDGSPDERQSLYEVMESIIQQLVRNDRMECVDAYQTLASAVKAYDELPEQPILKSKIHLITKSMKQHLSVLDNSNPKPADINLVTSALKVLVILVWNSDFSPYLNDEFRLFVLDKAISTIVEHRAPKSVIVHYLHFLATQDFRQNFFTSSRASRLIDALGTLTEHVKGNGVVSERLLVYSRLLDLSKAVMKSKAAVWVDHMLSAMASTISDTRMKALGLGRKACQCFPPLNSIATVVKAVLDSEQDERHTKGSAVCKKLEKLVITRDNADAVPQMWAVVILLCNSSSVHLSSWAGLQYWLQLIQRCFNASDPNLRIQADLAWNRFIYAARPHEAADDKFASMLAKPLVAQLERKSSDKGGKSTYSAAMSSYCNLLYYSMRPAISTQRLTKSWNEYIVKVMRSSFLQNPANADIACRILMSLFWNWKPGQKLWNENRAHENRVLEPEELPTIDCKWVRSKAAPITDLFAALFKHCSWGFADSADQAYVSRAWRSFIKSVRSASSKEIKMSNESRTSTLAILDFVTAFSASAAIQGAEQHQREQEVPLVVLSSIARIAVAELQVGHVLEALEASPETLSTTILRTLCHEFEKDPQIHSTAVSRQHPDSISRYTELLNTFLIQGHNPPNPQPKCGECVELLCKVLSLLKPEDAELALLKMQTGVSAHIRDEKRLLVSPGLDHLAQAFSRVIGKLQPQAVKKLDDLFAAAFASSHRTVVSSMSTTWNQTFGDCESLQIGPLLVQSLQRLRPYVELRMPSGCIDSWSEERDSIPVYDTQDDVSMPDPGVPIAQRSVQMTKDEPEAPNEDADVDLVADDDAEPVTLAVHHPRRDDSQVIFVPVHSSPPATAQDSQYLTEHQREVRDRQRSEPAVVFADLRSSPRPASRAPSESRDCGLARKAARLADRPSTPPLPDHGDEAEIQLSPTPKSRYIRNVADVEIPSSPPSIQDCHDQPADPCRAESSPLPPIRADNAPSTTVDLAEAGSKDLIDDDRPQNQEIESDRLEHMELDHDQGPDSGQPRLTKTLDLAEVLDHLEPGSPEELNGARNAAGKAGLRVEAPTSTEIEASEIQEFHNTPRTGLIINKPQREECSVRVEAPRDAPPEHCPEPSEKHIATQGASPDHGDAEPIEDDVSLLPSPDPRQLRCSINPPSTPARASSKIDSDELEIMSASQLSNDLDWSVVLHGLDKSPSSPPRRGKTVAEASVPPSSSQAGQGRSHGRKRKAAGSRWTRSKKSKRRSDAESQIPMSLESIVKIEEEDGDTIEVLIPGPTAPSPAPQIDADGDMFVDAPESQEVQRMDKRTRRRNGTQRKKLGENSRQSLKMKDRRASVNGRRSRRSIYSPGLELDSDDDLNKVGFDQNEGTDIEPSSSSPPRASKGAVQQPILIEDAPTQQQQQLDELNSALVGGAAGMVHSSEPRVDILGSLQHALDAVKNARSGSLDLRAIDEMCFQIRFQAQLKGAK